MWNDTVIESIRLATGDKLDLRSIDLGIHAIATLEQKRETLTFLIDRLKYLPYETRALQVEKLSTIISARLPDNLMMTSAQVRQLHDAGMEIGAHTVTHPILAKLMMRRRWQKSQKARQSLRQLLARKYVYLPTRTANREKIICRFTQNGSDAGFEAAVSTAWGAARQNSDIFQLPRFTPGIKVNYGMYCVWFTICAKKFR